MLGRITRFRTADGAHLKTNVVTAMNGALELLTQTVQMAIDLLLCSVSMISLKENNKYMYLYMSFFYIICYVHIFGNFITLSLSLSLSAFFKLLQSLVYFYRIFENNMFTPNWPLAPGWFLCCSTNFSGCISLHLRPKVRDPAPLQGAMLCVLTSGNSASGPLK